MIKLRIENNITKVVDATVFEKLVIKKACSYKVKGCEYIEAFRKGIWDGTKSLFDQRGNKLPSGLVPKVAAALKHHGMKYCIEDLRGEPTPLGKEIRNTIILRPYQERAIEEALKYKRGVVEAPTGSGKTVIAIALMCKMGLSTLIVTNKVDMIPQLSEEIKRFTGIECGVIGGGNVHIRPITVATIQTLSKMDLEEINHYFEVLIIDEYHHAASNSYLKVFAGLREPFYRFGFTATAFRNDDAEKILEATTGRIFCKIDAEELVSKGMLLKPTIKVLESTCSSDIRHLGEYHEVYQEGIVTNSQRNQLIVASAEKLVESGFKVLILVTKVEHGEIIKNMSGWVYINGSSSKNDRNLAKNRMKSGTMDVLIATSIFEEGIDMPRVSAVIFAGAGKSKVSVVQRVGRILRPSEGKKTAIVVDFSDDFHGMLIAQSNERKKIYRELGWSFTESKRKAMK